VSLFWIIVLGAIAAAWLLQAPPAIRGMLRLPRLHAAAPLADSACPTISVIFAARDEAAKLPRSLPTMLNQDYPDYEVIAVDDRSEDSTGPILDGQARSNSRLRVVHLRELPPGWLGKPYALAAGYRQARGRWLVFTDADVEFAPGLLRRAVGLAEAARLDHLTVLATVAMPRFWEKVAITYVGLVFVLGIRPWLVADPRAGSYMGVGAFQLVRREAYEAIGTHDRLALEVVDDMKLAKLVKLAGFRSAVATSDNYVRVRWQEGLGNIIRGLTKNMFAGLNYSVSKTLSSVAGILALSLLPFCALVFASGTARLLAAVSVATALTVQGSLLWGIELSPLYALTQPLGALIFCYILLRSMVVTLWRGGVVWRGTFYPLAELRKRSL
jgi:glycosyltransferase involved in cell wall biosynthesis